MHGSSTVTSWLRRSGGARGAARSDDPIAGYALGELGRFLAERDDS